MNLKDRGVYRLPNGRELVACITCDNKTVLFNLNASESGLYELNSEGRLLVDGQLTAWQVNDLLETGETAEPAVESVLEERSMARGSTHEQERT